MHLLVFELRLEVIRQKSVLWHEYYFIHLLLKAKQRHYYFFSCDIQPF